MGREIKFGLLAILFLIVLTAVVWDRFNLKKKIPPEKKIPSSPQVSVDEGEILEFVIGGGEPPSSAPEEREPVAPEKERSKRTESEGKTRIGSAEKGNLSASGGSGLEPPPSFAKHTVAPGESLAKISRKYYGKETVWKKLAEFNAIEDPLKLRTGAVLVIPLSGNAPQTSVSQDVRGPARKAGEYSVKRGDSLYSIAKNLLGDPQRWTELAALNGIDDPKKLKPGMMLKLH